MKKREITEALNIILKESEQFLYEKWSHYEEIDSALEHVYSQIKKAVYLVDDVTIIKNRLYLRRGKTKIFVFGKEVNLDFFVYIANDKEAAEYAIKFCQNNSYTIDNGKMMCLTIYTLNNELIEKESNQNVIHELKHVLQIVKSKNNNIDFERIADIAYDRMATILTNQSDFSEEEVNVAWLYYYSKPEEQDAFMEEYYKDLCWMKQNVFDDNSKIRQKINHFDKLLKWYEPNKDKQEVINAVSQYRVHGMPKRNFEVMIYNGYKRFLRKMKNIEKHFKETIKQLNESGFNHGINTKTGSLIHFRFGKEIKYDEMPPHTNPLDV